MNASAVRPTRPVLASIAGGLTVGLLAASLIAPAIGTARAQSPAPDLMSPVPQKVHTINVDGVGRVTVPPDVADVQLGVTFQAATAKESADLAADAMDAVIAALLAAGITETDIQTTQVSLNPVYGYDEEPPTIEGWEATNIVNVTLHEVTAVDDVVDAAISAGATNVQGVSFRVDDPTEAEAEARTAAVADAKLRADQLASDAGVSIIGVISITEVGPNFPEPIFLGGDTAGEGKESTAATPVLPGQVEVIVTVSIEYEIE